MMESILVNRFYFTLSWRLARGALELFRESRKNRKDGSTGKLKALDRLFVWFCFSFQSIVVHTLGFN